MNIAPHSTTLIEIVENAKEVAQNWDCITRKLLCCQRRKFQSKMPSSVLAKEVTAHFNDQQEATVLGHFRLI